MRQALGEKKLKRLRASTGLDVVKATVRGNTDHRIDLWLGDGSIASLWPNGELNRDPTYRWRLEEPA